MNIKKITLLTFFLVTSVELLSAGDVLLEHNFNGGDKAFSRNSNISIAKGAGPDGSDAIKVAYVGYSRGSKRVTGRYPLSKSVTEATLTFDVKFDKDFQWVKGGKLHGLAPANSVTGGAKRRKDAWSARMMFKQRGKIAYYIYDQNPKLKWGLEKNGSRSFKAGKWHTVTYKVKLNDPNKKNGYVYVAIDGKKAISSNKIKYRGVDGPSTLITMFLFNTFHGGHTPEWAPKAKKGKGFATVYAYYDNIKVVEGIE